MTPPARDRRQAAVHETNGSEARAKCPVTRALHEISPGALSQVRCEVQADRAILHGSVATFYLKQLAQEFARNIEGVEVVVNQLRVNLAQHGQTT